MNCSSKKSEWSASTDPVAIANGAILFESKCSTCHNFKQEGIGPNLGGVTDEVSDEWIAAFIKQPGVIPGDERTEKLFQQYKTPMPSFAQLKKEQVKELLSFLHTKPKPQYAVVAGNPMPLKNPVVDSIMFSGTTASLEPFLQLPPSSNDKELQTRITFLDTRKGSSDLYILDLRGKLYKVTGGKASVYMDMPKLRPHFKFEPGLATGFGSFAFHPDFADNGLLYTSHSEAAPERGATGTDFHYSDTIKISLQFVVLEWKTKNPGAPEFEGTPRELFRISMVTQIHGVQQIAFNPTAKKGTDDYGALYIGIGDGGAVETGHAFLAHNTKLPWGTIFRIDPQGKDGTTRHYGIPKSNPFGPKSGQLREIYAYGFRNPHRLNWSKDGRLFAANVGEANIESINLIEPGDDYGWPIREGTFRVDQQILKNIYPLLADDDQYHITYPVVQYDHREGKAITGGFEYTGTAVPAFIGKFIFGDIPTGRLFYAEMAEMKQGHQATVHEWRLKFDNKIQTLAEIHNHRRIDLHFGTDAKGELLVMTKFDGRVYRVTE